MSALGDRVIIGNPLPFLHWAQIRDYDNHVIATVVAFTHRRLMQRLHVALVARGCFA